MARRTSHRAPPAGPKRSPEPAGPVRIAARHHAPTVVPERRERARVRAGRRQDGTARGDAVRA
ncbi:hypothetical protein EJ357_36285 [Streptomyces cyaneochromogenes]|uniref:Uncharacterized protein n=1 Tax=Streptomyces cyaneochromogenes TaxID=2496836 RepID=A0A3Q9EYI7_9ACTN|nr:hypothetical protein [Streptomyces cyaneochromogenes]AZQ38244.1 hypothetical protein EJ357_36285 [Streptomyces cyaneochromogenes]